MVRPDLNILLDPAILVVQVGVMRDQQVHEESAAPGFSLQIGNVTCKQEMPAGVYSVLLYDSRPSNYDFSNISDKVRHQF